MRRADELDLRKSLLQVTNHPPLPFRVQMHVDLIDQDDAGRLLQHRRNVTIVQGNIRHEARILHDSLGRDVGDQRDHHSLPRAQVRERLRLALDGQNDLLSITVVPEIVGIGHAPNNGVFDDFVPRPPAPGPVGGGHRLALKPDSQITQADAFFEAIVECLPTAGRAARLDTRGASGSRRKPRATRPVVGDYRTRNVPARTVSREVLIDDAQGLGDGHGLALDELRPVAGLHQVEANLLGKDVPPAVREHGIGRSDEPDPGRDRQRVQNRRLSGAVVAHQQGKARMQLQRVVGEALEVPYPDSIDSHIPLYFVKLPSAARPRGHAASRTSTTLVDYSRMFPERQSHDADRPPRLQGSGAPDCRRRVRY